MTDKPGSFLSVLNDVEWDRVFNTFGNCHSTLVGALVLAWNRSATMRSALESGLSPVGGHLGSRFCDAILCEGDYANPTPVGIVEVEGKPFPSTRQKRGETSLTIFQRMEKYWCPGENKGRYFCYFGSLSFAVLVVYPFLTDDELQFGAAGRRVLSESPRFVECVRKVRPDFRFFVVIVHKCREESIKDSIRKNPYKACTISKVEWFEVGCSGLEAGSGSKTNARVLPA